MIVYLETNFILAQAKGQEPRGGELLDISGPELRLVIPEICLLEAWQAYRRLTLRRQRFDDAMAAQVRDLTRDASSHAATLVRAMEEARLNWSNLTNDIDRRFRESVEMLTGAHGTSRRAERVIVSPQAVGDALRPQTFRVKLKPADNLILRTVVRHAAGENDPTKIFLSGNTKDFGQPDVKALLRAESIEYVTKCGGSARKIQADLGWPSLTNRLMRMNRRTFLTLAAVSPLAHLLPTFAGDDSAKRPGKELAADLVIVGGGVGGVACALAAARNGLRVILTEQFDWIGGQLTSQAVPPDEYPTVETFPCTRAYGAFRSGVREYYRRHYPLTEAARGAVALNPGNGTVSKLCHEPRVALAVLLEMLAPHVSGGRVRILQPCVPVRADVKGDRVAAVTVRNARTGAEHVLVAPFFVDATETGELLPLTKTEFVSGAESREQTKEPHAGETADPGNHQAFTVCFAMEHVEGEDFTIDKPEGYAFWREYVPEMTPAWPGKLLSWRMSHPATLQPREMGMNPTGATPAGVYNLWAYRRIADQGNFTPGTYRGDVTLVNWPQNDYLPGNLFGGTAGEDAEHQARGKQLSLCLFYWLRTEAPRPDGKRGWPGLRLRPEVMGTDDGLAMAPYVRESRRIRAEFTVTENQVGTEARVAATGKKAGDVTAEPFFDSVGVGSYRIDLHPSTRGRNYVDVSSLPFQVPLGALLPVRVNNLLPACKNIGTTHVTNGCYRLHPVEWSIGEAVGELVAFCMAKKVDTRKVRGDRKVLEAFQGKLRGEGVELEWPGEVKRVAR